MTKKVDEWIEKARLYAVKSVENGPYIADDDCREIEIGDRLKKYLAARIVSLEKHIKKLEEKVLAVLIKND